MQYLDALNAYSPTFSPFHLPLKYDERKSISKHEDPKYQFNDFFGKITRVMESFKPSVFPNYYNSIELLTDPRTQKQYQMTERINSFRSLASGWNGEGSLRIDEKLIPQANEIVMQASIVPQAFPCGDGGIDLEFFHKETKSFVIYFLRSEKQFDNSEFIFQQNDVILEQGRISKNTLYHKLNRILNGRSI